MSLPQELLALRDDFDDVDRRIIALLARRAGLSRAAAELKRAHGLPVVDESREDATREARQAHAAALGLDPAVVDVVFAAIVSWSRALQSKSDSGGSVPMTLPSSAPRSEP